MNRDHGKVNLRLALFSTWQRSNLIGSSRRLCSDWMKTYSAGTVATVHVIILYYLIILLMRLAASR